jgi:hypothetical protein
MKKITVLVLLFLLLATINLQGANAESENIQLIPGTYIVKVFELQQGDYFEGSFNISTLYSYRSSYDNRIYTYWVAVDAFDPERNIIVDYSEIDDKHIYQFKVIANCSGRYEVRFTCGYNFFPPEAIVPQATFNYNITSNTQPTSTVQPNASPIDPTYRTVGYILLAIVTVTVVGALILMLYRRKDVGIKDSSGKAILGTHAYVAVGDCWGSI